MIHRFLFRLYAFPSDLASRWRLRVAGGCSTRFVCAAVCAVFFFSSPSISLAAKPATVEFNVPAQSLTIALMSLGLQGDVEILFSYEELKGLQAPQISGKMTTDRALALILKGTNYTAYRQPGRAKSFKIVAPQFAAQAAAITERARVNAVAVAEKARPAPLPVGDASVDRPRTPDDLQPYVVFDGEKVEQSGALTVGDFLAERLPSSSGATLSGEVGLRGLGSRYTRVLVDGREQVVSSGLPSFGTGLDYRTSKLSLIPLSSIKRIEVLPQSASGAAMGGTIGGAINVITKRDYTGGEITLGYDNSFDSDSANRKAEMRYGASLNGGRTRLMFFAGVNDSNSLVVQDRYDLIRDYAARATTLTPGVLNGTDILLGSTPRVDSSDGSPLVLKTNGQALNSSFVFLPSGYRGVELDGTAGLVANAGKIDPNFPDTAQAYLGRRLLLHRRPDTQSLRTEFRQAVASSLEAYFDFSYEKSSRDENAALFSSNTFVTVPVGIPTNPFGQEVRVRFPYEATAPHESSRLHRSMTGGLLFSLPSDWSARLEHTRTYNRSVDRAQTGDFERLKAAINAGTLNVFQDSLQLAGFLSDYTTTRTGRGSIESVDSLVRADGGLSEFFSLQPRVALGAQWRQVSRKTFEIDDGTATTKSGLLPASNSTSALFAEVTLPLFAENGGRSLPGLRLFELVASGRREKSEVRTEIVKSTGSQTVDNLASPPVREILRSRFTSTNPVYGFRYKPVDDVMLRASFSRGVLPIADYQVLPKFTSTGTVTDPKRGNAQKGVSIVSGGNAGLSPEESETVSTGAVFSPRGVPGLRLSVDFSSVEKKDAVDILDTQSILAYESLLPGRVTRDPLPGGDTFVVGPIAKIDASALNLYSAKLAAWDVSAGYKKEFSHMGTFDLSALYTLHSKFEQQVVPGGPLVDLVNAPYYVGPFRDRASASLLWTHGAFGAGWATRYHGRYKSDAAPAVAPTQLPDTNTLGMSARVYHDAFLRYRFSPTATNGVRGWLGGTEVLLGVRNLFNAAPLFDASLPSNLFLNANGDLRGDSYYMSLKREF